MRVEKVCNFHSVQFAENGIVSQIWSEHGVDCVGGAKECLDIDDPVGPKAIREGPDDLRSVSAGIEFHDNSPGGAPDQGGANRLPASKGIARDGRDRITVVVWTAHRHSCSKGHAPMSAASGPSFALRSSGFPHQVKA